MSRRKSKPSSLGKQLRELREQNELSLTLAAAKAKVDIAILSKVERGGRKITKSLLLKLATIYKADTKPLLIQYLSEKVLNILSGEEYSSEALKMAVKKMEEIKSKKVKRTK